MEGYEIADPAPSGFFYAGVAVIQVHHCPDFIFVHAGGVW